MTKNARDLLSEPYLTVGQVAAQISVHPSTVRRWIDQGRLAAYRLGDKRIGVRPSDVARLVTPRPVRPVREAGMARPEQFEIPPLTKEQQRRGLQALAELERFRDELVAKQGKLTPESWELLNHTRDERTRDLMQAAEA